MSNIVIPTITVNGQTILHTENKYCGENIEVNVAIPNPTLDGTAITDYVLAPYTFYKDNLTKLIGTMVNRGAISTDITTKAQEVTIQQGYHSGSGVVKISAAEQAKIIASNIKNGVTLLGQSGTVTPAKEEQTKTVSPTTSDQDVLPDTGKVLNKVTVNAIPTETKSQQPNLESGNQVIDATSGKFMTSFTITKDTVNHIASNIRSGKTLYGVEGSLQPAKEEETKTVTPNFASGNVVVTPTSGKVMTQVTVNKDTTNHIAGNIKSGVTLYGVTGNYEGSGGGGGFVVDITTNAGTADYRLQFADGTGNTYTSSEGGYYTNVVWLKLTGGGMMNVCTGLTEEQAFAGHFLTQDVTIWVNHD